MPMGIKMLLRQQYTAEFDAFSRALDSIAREIALGTFTETPIEIKDGDRPLYCGICWQTFVTHHSQQYQAVTVKCNSSNDAQDDMVPWAIHMCHMCNALCKQVPNPKDTPPMTYKIIQGRNTQGKNTQGKNTLNTRAYVALALLRYYGIAKISKGEHDKSFVCTCCMFSTNFMNINVTLDNLTTRVCDRCFSKSNHALARIHDKRAIVVSVVDVICQAVHLDIRASITYYVINIGIV